MRSETTQRVITAAVLIVVAVSVIIYWPALLVASMMVGLISLIAWEWTHLAMLTGRRQRALYSAATAATAGGVMYLGAHDLGTTVIFIGCAWWLVAALLLFNFQAGRMQLSWRTSLLLPLGWVLMLPVSGALAALFQADRPILLLFMVMIWVADSAAYFGGRRWGKHKLATRISPGKTWEGFLVALVAVTALTIGYALARGHAGREVLAFGALGAACTAVSVVGDLFLSLIKRNAKLKDSGTLLPGHGGIWDRIDGVTAAAPLFAIVWHGSGVFQ